MSKIKHRYLLFGHDEYYYAKGGACDFLESGNDLQDLIDCKKADDVVWWHIFDTEKNKIVAGTKTQAHGAQDLVIDSGNKCL